MSAEVTDTTVRQSTTEGGSPTPSVSALASRDGVHHTKLDSRGRAARQQDFVPQSGPVGLHSLETYRKRNWTWLGPFSGSVLCGVVRSSPITLILPLLIFAVCTGLSLFGLFAASRNTVATEKDVAMELATDAARRIELQIAQAFTPTITMEIFVRETPNLPDLQRSFPRVAQQLLQKVLPGTIANLQLAPNLVVQAIHPLTGNERVIGLDLLAPTSDPVRLADVLGSLAARNLTVSGPYKLVQGGYGVVIRQPVFIANVSANVTFGANATAQPCPECYDAANRTKLWGFVQALARLDGLLQGSDNRLQALQEYGPWHLSRLSPNGSETVIASHNAAMTLTAANHAADPVVVDVTLPNAQWRLYLSHKGGWAPAWGALIALVVVGSFLVSVMLFGMLVAGHRHRALLRAMFPAKVLRPLQQGKNFSEEFDSVTILFSDIVSYTTISSSLRPIEVAEMLNELYCEFDDLVDKNGCYKVETIGDAFMVAGGCPVAEPPEAAAERVAQMALSMVATAAQFRSSKGHCLRIRVGLASGPVAAAVIGRKMPRYCLFGDTVNLASRMESGSEPMRIQVSATTASLLRACSSSAAFLLLPRGTIQVKGKGSMQTFWLEHSGLITPPVTVPAAMQRHSCSCWSPGCCPWIHRGGGGGAVGSRVVLPPQLPISRPLGFHRPAQPQRQQSMARDGDAGPQKHLRVGAEAVEVEVPVAHLTSALSTVGLATCLTNGDVVWQQPTAAPAVPAVQRAPVLPPPPPAVRVSLPWSAACLATSRLAGTATDGVDLTTISRPNSYVAGSTPQLMLPKLTDCHVGAGGGAGRATSAGILSTGPPVVCGDGSGGSSTTMALGLINGGGAVRPAGLSAPDACRCGNEARQLRPPAASRSPNGTLTHGSAAAKSPIPQWANTIEPMHWTNRHLVRHGEGSGYGGNSPGRPSSAETAAAGLHTEDSNGSFRTLMVQLPLPPPATCTASMNPTRMARSATDGTGRSLGQGSQPPQTARDAKQTGGGLWQIAAGGLVHVLRKVGHKRAEDHR